MIGSTISHYAILEKLGEGGMGIVYKARDTKLDRMVALKCLPPHLAASVQDKNRFIQEAKAASALNHPNVCTIHDIQEHESPASAGAPAGRQMFIVMEFVDGQTLREKRESIGYKQAMDIGIQIADGLAAAHEKGVVHRDVKADNVMVRSDGRVQIMDFGLAKLHGASSLTKAGSTIGTTAYMSPEQVQGLDADHRTDIFSLGVVLYELLTGRLPFRAGHEAAVMYEIVNVGPTVPELVNPEIEAEVGRIVMKCLEKDPENRYQSAREVAVDLKRYRRDSGGNRPTGSSAAAPSRAASKQSFRLKLGMAAGLVAIAATAAAYWMKQQEEDHLTSLAVMPFVNATGDQNLEYLTDGVTESIIASLSRLSNLRVMSRSSVFRYKGKDFDPQEVGKALNVRALLTGRMTQRPDGFSLSLELVDTKDNRQIWGDHYIRRLPEISTLETEIPKEISERLRVGISGEERENLNTPSTRNPEAYELYLKGRFNWNKRLPDALHRAIELYSQAIEQDPLYAQAYTGIAETYVIIPVYVFPPPREAYKKAKYFAAKALELNSKQAEAYTALAYAKWGELDWEGAEQDFKHAIGLNPQYATGHHWYSLFLSTSGKHDEALAEAKKAQELDPLSLIIQGNVGTVLYSAGRHEEAIAQMMKVLAVEPTFPISHLLLGNTYLQMGRTAEALSEFEKARAILGGVLSPHIATAYALLGKREEARKILDGLEKQWKNGERLEGAIALAYIGLGQKEKALEWLDKLYNSRFITVSYLWSVRDFPKLTGMDSDPRIQALLKRIGVK